MGWSLPKLNPVGKILGKSLVKDRWTKNKSSHLTDKEIDEQRNEATHTDVADECYNCFEPFWKSKSTAEDNDRYCSKQCESRWKKPR